MRVGIVVLPQGPWREQARRWQRAEEYGFAHAWTYDHLAWGDLAGEPWYATVPTLTAAALVTSTIRLGTWVASPNVRHPVPFAKEVMTLDEVSGGRVEVGLGAGGLGLDARVLGAAELTPRQRVDRLGEFVQLLDLLLRQRETTWRGEWYSAVDARMVPGPVQQPRPPIVLAANAPRGIRLAVRYADGWATTGRPGSADGDDAWWAGVGSLLDRVREECAAAGRDPASLRTYVSMDAAPTFSMSSAEAFRDATGRARELGFTDAVTHWPRRATVYVGSEAVLDEVAGDLAPK